MKWRLMTHSELEQSYKDDDEKVYSDHAYITRYPDWHGDPLYSIDVYDKNNEEYNTNLALAICEELNSRFELITERKV